MSFARPVTMAFLAVVWAPVCASAQVRCLSSYPGPGSRLEAPPRSVLLWMSEPVDAQLSRFHVMDPHRRRFDLPPKVSADGLRVEVPLRPLPDGVYVVHYRAASVLDGHVSVGLYRFGVRTAAASSQDPPWLGRGAGLVFTLAAAATGSALAAALAAGSALLEWAQSAASAVPAPWAVLLRGGWAGLLLAGTQPGWASLLGAATAAVWAVRPGTSLPLIRLVGAVWLLLVTPLVAAAGGPLSLLASSHGPALVLMMVAYGAVGVLAAFAVPVLGIRLEEPSWTLPLLSLLLSAAWALRSATGVGDFFATCAALWALCVAAHLWGRTRRDRRKGG